MLCSEQQEKAKALSAPSGDPSQPETASIDVRGRGVWKCNTSVLRDEHFQSDFKKHFEMWNTLKPAFTSIIEWWDDVKERAKDLIFRHSVRVAQVRWARLENLKLNLNQANRKEFEDLLDRERKGAFIRSRTRFLGSEEEAFAFFHRQERYRAADQVIRPVRDHTGFIVTDSKDVLKASVPMFTLTINNQTSTITIDFFLFISSSALHV
ncbi:hypothetical protein HOLleu_41472 [Holothuria leucospilota]|uniref:Uncharacterized protein n=1 Tax=Holothuria leucospilota TaxID=206669 RepID=A0A9Q1BBV0_HOLLE|nr:hypothetical protein HOLleu_41472 [Holothuria leucospilota]